MLVMVIVKIVFNIVPLLSFALLPCMLVTLRFVILRTCHPDGTEGSFSPVLLDASLRSSMTGALHANDKNDYRHYFIMRR